MSINVTVSGNPVRINRGKMVTSLDPAKTEFEKRRLIRLEQVRQQSKDIAENVRNKLKKEKTKCLSTIEKEGEAKLKNWQARKLLELQNQYQEALDDIGLGHKSANLLEDEEEIFVEQQESNERIARERGRVATELMQIERNEENLRKAMPRQRKIFTSDVENSRSNEVVHSRKTKGKSAAKKKKKESFDSDGENRVPQLMLDGGPSEHSDSSSGMEEVTRKRTGVIRPTKEQGTTTKMSKEQQTSAIGFQVPTSDKAAQTTCHQESVPPASTGFSLDNRISERIKRRARLNAESDCCDFVEKTCPRKETCCTCCQHPVKHQEVPEVHTRVVREISVQTDDKGENTRRIPTEIIIADKEGSRYDFGTGNLPAGSQKPKSGVQIPTHDEDSRYPIETRKPSDSQKLKTGAQVSTASHKDDRIGSKTTFTAPGPSSSDQGKTAPIGQKSVDRRIVPQNFDDRKVLPSRQRLNDRRTGLAPKDNIPVKPKVTLRSSKDRPVLIHTDNTQPVQYYDHPNRFAKTYVPRSSHVEKIDEEELVVSPNIFNEEDQREKIRQRDIEAHRRGQLALEKEKIQRDYRELIRKLPALQNQERIFEIGADKEKYHMSRDRLEELEKKRQNRLDNAYEELFVRNQPAVVTLPKRNIDKDEDPRLNLASWSGDFNRQEIDENRREKLNGLLSDLQTQKRSLLKQIESTLSKDTLMQLAGSTEGVKSKSTDYTRATRKRSRDDRPFSPTSSDVVLEEESSERTKKSKKGTTSPTPRKKAKSSRKVLILQNSSTQTTPKTCMQSASTSPITTTTTARTVPETSTSTCPCKEDPLEDLCEIIIKIKEDDKPEVQVIPPSLRNSVKVVTETKEPSRVEAPKKSSSWKEQLTQSGTSLSTSSTSYLDPPGKKKTKKVKSPETEISKSTNGTVSSNSGTNGTESRSLNSTTSSSGGKQLDPRLLTYIKKLLNMSRGNIDELTVSTASEVSTPGHSVINTPSNNPLLQLMNVMKYFNIDVADLQQQLSYTSDESSRRYNTNENLTISSRSSEGQRSHVTSRSESVKEVVESNKQLLQYADIAASCTKKINDLTAKIEKVRAEKKRMLESSSSSSDKELTTTSYKELPDKKDKKVDEKTSQNEVDKLLKVDLGYAEKLKQLTEGQIQSEKQRTNSELPSDDELLNRLKRLLQANPQEVAPEQNQNRKSDRTVVEMSEKRMVQERDGEPVGLVSQTKLAESRKDGKTVGMMSGKTTVTLKPAEDQGAPPLFLDIPKLPKLEASLNKKKNRPPPSKGLRAIAAHSPVVPHELSTIVEADSQISTKADSPSKTKTSLKSTDMPDILSEVKSSSDEVSELDTMETMLISIGMEWAIPTLKKTREALAMASSSSGGSKESGEVSLREFLSKMSNSNSKSGEGSSMSDSHGMSLIQVDQRRTSTPIIMQGDKKEGPIFVTDSDVSSVRETSEQHKDSEILFDANDGTAWKAKC